MSASRIYKHPKHPSPPIPSLDLLSFLYDSEYSASQDTTVLHAEAANPNNHLTKAKSRELVERIAHGLRKHYRIGSGGPNKDVVTVISYGQLLITTLFGGIIASGGVWSAASPSSTVDELARQIKMGKSNLVICGPQHLSIAREAARKQGIPLSRVLVLDSAYGRWSLKSLEGGINAISAPNQRLAWQRITDPVALKDSLIVILWSSGTTGLPKGVMLSHYNLIAESTILTLGPRELVMKEMEEKGDAFQPPPPFCTIAHLPISHIAGLFGYFVMTTAGAGTLYWMGKYNWADLLKYAKAYQITYFYTVPSIYMRISKSPDVTDQFAHVTGAATGAAPMDGPLQKSASSRLGSGKQQMLGQTWGLSETTGAVTAQPPDAPDDTGSIGAILPGIELRIVDDGYRDVEPGQEGELIVRGPVVMRGYFDNPQATREAFHEDWFCTGDIGVLRNGKFYVVDRKKELLKYKGNQVAPAELEGLLIEHPKIREAAVIGVPDQEAGDLPRAYVVPVDRSSISEDEVKRYIAERVAPYKQLRGGVAFIDEIPKNAIGKFLRKDLREKAKKELGIVRSKL